MLKKPDSLKPGTLLDDYRLTEILGGGGFSIVYLARHRRDGKPYVIKEFIPNKLALRNPNGEVIARSSDTEKRLSHGRKLFFQEAKTLATLKHPNIVKVVNFFRANNTVYMVMEHKAGENLQDLLKKHKKKGLSGKFMLTVFPRLLDGLELIHNSDLLHLDIKPGNIHIRTGGRPLLLDFGAVHGYPHSVEEKPGQVTSPGFSPIEQYDNRSYVGPWTDIYALGATMRSCLDGQPPPNARDRKTKDKLKPATVVHKKNYTYTLLEAMDWAMEMDPMLRPQNVAEFREALTRTPDPAFEDSGSTLERFANNLLGKIDS